MHNASVDTDWLKSRKKERGVTDLALAEALGVERSVANKIVNGKVEFNAKKADAVAKLLGVSRDEMLVRAGIVDGPASRNTQSDHQPTRTVDSGEAVPVTSLDLSLSMGPGTLIEDFVEAEPTMLDLALLRTITRTPTDRLRLVRGIGHSMEPTLRTDDRVLIDINDRGLSSLGGVYWIDFHGAHGIKRLRPAGKGRVLVMSDNPVEGHFEAAASDIRIEGRAIWFARDL